VHKDVDRSQKGRIKGKKDDEGSSELRTATIRKLTLIKGWDDKRIMAIADHRIFAVFQRYNNPNEEDIKARVLAPAPASLSP
jgi:hypothetical protein